MKCMVCNDCFQWCADEQIEVLQDQINDLKNEKRAGK
jgi:Pyruvate/2-oxoacid:ferredoxin oxidoreductase delta subunit